MLFYYKCYYEHDRLVSSIIFDLLFTKKIMQDPKLIIYLPMVSFIICWMWWIEEVAADAKHLLTLIKMSILAFLIFWTGTGYHILVMPISSFSLCKMLPKNGNREVCLVRGRTTTSFWCKSIYIRRSLNYCNNFKNFSHEQLH